MTTLEINENNEILVNGEVVMVLDEEYCFIEERREITFEGDEGEYTSTLKKWNISSTYEIYQDLGEFLECNWLSIEDVGYGEDITLHLCKVNEVDTLYSYAEKDH
jgi:hypothetical protein